MFITRIKISNFKGIREIDLDLDVNINNIQEDLDNGKFKLIDQKKPVSGITALIGRNSVGKSTIIQALSFLKDFETDQIDKWILDQTTKEALDISRTNFLKKAGNMDRNQWVKLNDELFQKHMDILIQTSKKEGSFFDQYLLQSDKWFLNFFNNFVNDRSQEKIKFEIFFQAEENKSGQYQLTLDHKGLLLRDFKGDFEIKDYQNYFSKVKVKACSTLYNLSPVQKSNYDSGQFFEFNQALESIIAKVGEEKTTAILKLCDEDIEGIQYSSADEKVIVKGIIINNNKIIQPDNLSSGTQQFILFTEKVITICKRKSQYGLLLIDEIENNFHNELIQSLLQMLIGVFKDFNVQSIITTHNLRALKPLLSNKQIISIEKTYQTHKLLKASIIMKPHESLLTKQDQGLIAYYPDPNLIRNTIADFLYELKYELK